MKNIATAYNMRRYAHGGKAKLGSGKRFASLEHSLAEKPGVTDPKALAASIGQKKYGAEKMAKMAAHNRKAMGGEVENPTLHQSKMAKGGMMCAHGGPAMCAHGCYGEGGEIHGGYDSAEGFADNDDDLLDESGEQAIFDADNFDDTNNEDGDYGASIDHEDASEGTRKYAKGGMIMSKLLGRIMKMHRGH